MSWFLFTVQGLSTTTKSRIQSDRGIEKSLESSKVGLVYFNLFDICLFTVVQVIISLILSSSYFTFFVIL